MKTFHAILEGPTGNEKIVTGVEKNKEEFEKVTKREYPHHTIIEIEEEK